VNHASTRTSNKEEEILWILCKLKNFVMMEMNWKLESSFDVHVIMKTDDKGTVSQIKVKCRYKIMATKLSDI